MIPCYLFRIASQCWLCSARLATKKDLRAHIGSSSHLRVLCPWCLDKEYTSNRMGDLKKHASTNHGAEYIVPSGFFSDGNGFYLAIYPQDYASHHSNPPPPPLPPKKPVMFVRQWLQGVPSSSRTLQDWE